ncbi:MAG: hypothetical protein OJI74_01865, partial [Rhodanobacter thiooxydans]|nr:hypothetical protein [Rhodanobacter thiooxydans]
MKTSTHNPVRETSTRHSCEGRNRTVARPGIRASAIPAFAGMTVGVWGNSARHSCEGRNRTVARPGIRASAIPTFAGMTVGVWDNSARHSC